MAELPPGLQQVLQKQVGVLKSSSKSSDEQAIVPEPTKKRDKSPKRQSVCNNPKKWLFDPAKNNWAVSCERLKNYVTGLVYTENPNAPAEGSDDDKKKHSKKHKKKDSKKHKKKGKAKKTVLAFGVAPFYPRIPGFMRITDGDILNLQNINSKEIGRTIDLSEYNTRVAEWKMIKSKKASDEDSGEDSNEKEPTLEQFRKLLKRPTGVLQSEDNQWQLTLSIVDHPTLAGRAVMRLDKIEVTEPSAVETKPDAEAKLQRRLKKEVEELLEFNQKNDIIKANLPNKRKRTSRFSALDLKLLLYNSDGEEAEGGSNEQNDDSVEIPVQQDE